MKPLTPDTQEARFLLRVRKTDSCWMWDGVYNDSGYPTFGRQRAYRLSHELYKGPIPAGFDIDHLCRVPGCVNPAHLEAVTPEENQRRRLEHLESEMQQREYCRHGHLLAETAKRDTRGARQCGLCHALQARASRARVKTIL
jgi:hypothetical protein